MDIQIGSMRPEEEMDKNARPEVSAQHKKASGERTELQEMKTLQEKGKQQETSYDVVSVYGDTLSISEAGRDVNLGKKNILGSIQTEDGIVIRTKVEENELKDDVSTVNLSIYTETELKQMYLDGDITRTEYDEEINSRER